ncbi:MAG: VacJ family lipoprotein [Phycisphaerae bacterium]|nr:VacJ family lipoprotein [Phycisphaerae bacterium]
MKKNVCTFIALFVVTGGCAVSEKSPSSNDAVGHSGDRWRVISAAKDAAQAQGAQTEADVDKDFDLLEDELTGQMVEISDPLESWNRLMFHVNDGLYFLVVKPVAEVYTNVAPEPARIGISNFFQNLTTPVRFVNCLLQGKGNAAGTELDRFLINTTAGVLGFGDPARDEHGLEPADEDLGQTLAVAGFDNGFYIIWPLLGPSTARDSVGMVGDMFLNPIFYVEHTETAISISAVKFTNEITFHIGEYEAFKSESLDPYVVMRDIYIQYRNKIIQE